MGKAAKDVVRWTDEERHPLQPLVAGPRVARDQDAYERQGTGHLCRMFEPLAGRREGRVTERRTAVDDAAAIQQLVDVS